MKSFASTVKSRYTRGISAATKRLDADERRTLADEVEAALASGQAAHHDSSPVGQYIDAYLAQVEENISDAKARLTELESSERFVAMRCRRYRLTLEERASELDRLAKGVGRDDGATLSMEERDEEGGGFAGKTQTPEEMAASAGVHIRPPQSPEELAKMLEKQTRDEEALDGIIETHMGMLANVERMRRKILDLELKRDELTLGRNDMREFLVAAGEAEEIEIGGEVTVSN